MRRLTVLVLLVVTADLTVWSAVVPLLPDYRAQMHLTTSQAGLVLAAFSAAVVVAAVPAGHLSDRLGARGVTAVGVAALVCSTAGLGLATDFPVLLAARICQGAADAMAWTAGVAWVVSVAPSERRGRVVAVVEAGATVGIVLGPLLGGVGTSLVGIRDTFLGVAGLLALLFVWTLLERAGSGGPAEQTPPLRTTLRASLREPVIAAAIGMILLVALVGAALQLLLPLHLSAQGVGRSGIGLIFTAAAILGTVVTLISGRLGDRTGRLPLAIGASLALAAACAALAVPAGRTVFVVAVVAFSGVQAVLYAVGYPLGADGADRAGLGHGVVLGVINLIWGAGAVIGPLAASNLAGLTGERPAYMVLAALCVVAAVGLEAARRRVALADARSIIDAVAGAGHARPEQPS